jgi:hypothetical protein
VDIVSPTLILPNLLDQMGERRSSCLTAALTGKLVKLLQFFETRLGAVLVTAAGNGNLRGVNCDSHYPHAWLKSGDLPNLLVVGGTNPYGGRDPASEIFEHPAGDNNMVYAPGFDTYGPDDAGVMDVISGTSYGKTSSCAAFTAFDFISSKELEAGFNLQSPSRTPCQWSDRLLEGLIVAMAAPTANPGQRGQACQVHTKANQHCAQYQ